MNLRNIEKLIKGKLGVLITSASLASACFYILYTQSQKNNFSITLDEESMKQVIEVLAKSNNQKTVTGLHNKGGNTCFVNCVLQALSSSQHFLGYLSDLMQETIKINFLDEKDQLSQIILVELALIQADLISIKDTVSAESLIAYLENEKDYTFYREQQDSHELLNVLMGHIGHLEGELRQGLRGLLPFESERVNPLKGFTKSFVFCPNCDSQYDTMIETHYGLSLDIRHPGVRSLEQALALYFQPEIIEGYRCIKCGLKEINRNGELDVLLKSSISDVKQIEQRLKDIMPGKKLQIVQRNVKRVTQQCKLPAVQMFHFKRITTNFYGEIVKIQKHVQFEEFITIKSEGKQSRYVLTSVIAHYGHESFGHYVTFKRMEKKDQLIQSSWFLASDDLIKEISAQDVFGSQAYMLFYDKV